MIHRDLILPVPVLLIDDQVEASQNLSHILQNFGYPKEVLLCSPSLANAVLMVQQHLPNLVFINLQSWSKAQIDFIKYHYETECTVRWNENLSETKIKNASITAV